RGLMVRDPCGTGLGHVDHDRWLRVMARPLGQHARRARAPVRRRLALERRLLVLQPRRVALAAGEPLRGGLELVLDLAGALVALADLRTDVDAPRPVDVDAG